MSASGNAHHCDAHAPDHRLLSSDVEAKKPIRRVYFFVDMHHALSPWWRANMQRRRRGGQELRTRCVRCARWQQLGRIAQLPVDAKGCPRADRVDQRGILSEGIADEYWETVGGSLRRVCADRFAGQGGGRRVRVDRAQI